MNQTLRIPAGLKLVARGLGNNRQAVLTSVSSMQHCNPAPGMCSIKHTLHHLQQISLANVRPDPRQTCSHHLYKNCFHPLYQMCSHHLHQMYSHHLHPTCAIFSITCSFQLQKPLPPFLADICYDLQQMRIVIFIKRAPLQKVFDHMSAPSPANVHHYHKQVGGCLGTLARACITVYNPVVAVVRDQL